MSDPMVFDSASPRYNLPLLFSGQVQKEFFVNEAHALTDALLHPAVEGEADDPPASPSAGDTWLVGAVPTGAWADRAGCLASFQAGTWLFIEPRDGLHALDRSSGQDIRYDSGWQRAEAPASPTGGATVDSQARAAIVGLIDALVTAGILPAV